MSNIYLLNNMKFDGIKNIPLLKIQYLPKEIDIKSYDALIFTSKNAIYAIDSFCKDWKKIPSYAITSKTADIIKKLGGIIEFEGENGHGNEFALELVPYLKNKKVLFLRAKKVVSNLVNILQDKNINIHDIAVYETICNEIKTTSLPKNSIIIFSSPSTVKYFFKQFLWDNSFKAISIGKTTANYLPNNIDSYICEKTSIQECINLAKKLQCKIK